VPFGAWLSLPLDYPCTNMTLQPTARRAEDLQQRSQHGWGLGRMQSLRLQGSTDSRIYLCLFLTPIAYSRCITTPLNPWLKGPLCRGVSAHVSLLT
jgi:hypothetical protein